MLRSLTLCTSVATESPLTATTMPCSTYRELSVLCGHDNLLRGIGAASEDPLVALTRRRSGTTVASLAATVIRGRTKSRRGAVRGATRSPGKATRKGLETSHSRRATKQERVVTKALHAVLST